jgi:hypothetical protein
MPSDEVDGRQKILLESIAQARPLLVEVCDGFVNLGFGGLEESCLYHFVRARSRANTSSSAGNPLYRGSFGALCRRSDGRGKC